MYINCVLGQCYTGQFLTIRNANIVTHNFIGSAARCALTFNIILYQIKHCPAFFLWEHQVEYVSNHFTRSFVIDNLHVTPNL